LSLGRVGWCGVGVCSLGKVVLILWGLGLEVVLGRSLRGRSWSRSLPGGNRSRSLANWSRSWLKILLTSRSSLGSGPSLEVGKSWLLRSRALLPYCNHFSLRSRGGSRSSGCGGSNSILSLLPEFPVVVWSMVASGIVDISTPSVASWVVCVPSGS